MGCLRRALVTSRSRYAFTLNQFSVTIPVVSVRSRNPCLPAILDITTSSKSNLYRAWRNSSLLANGFELQINSQKQLHGTPHLRAVNCAMLENV